MNEGYTQHCCFCTSKYHSWYFYWVVHNQYHSCTRNIKMFIHKLHFRLVNFKNSVVFDMYELYKKKTCINFTVQIQYSTALFFLRERDHYIRFLNCYAAHNAKVLQMA